MDDAEPTLNDLLAKASLLEAKLYSGLLETSVQWFDQFVDPREPLFDSEDFWLPLGYAEQVPWNIDSRKRGEVLPIYLTEPGLKVIRDVSRKMSGHNEFAINALENRTSYIVGTGCNYTVAAVDDAVPDAWVEDTQRIVDDFLEFTDWGSLEQEIVRRNDRDGEAILRFFPQGDGTVHVRIVEPEHVKAPAQASQERTMTFGVESDRLDVETVHAYWLVEDPDTGTATERVPADEILHLKLNVDRSAKRGLPTFFPIRKNFDRADKLLRNMSLMAQVQATFALIRKYKGYSAASVQAANANDLDWTVTSAMTGRQSSFRQYQPGSVVDVPDGVDYEFPAGNVNAAAYVVILQAELRAIAARLVMPEYMLTADASNANFASTMVAESPSVKNFQRLQSFYLRKFGQGRYHGRLHRSTGGRHIPVLWRVIRTAVRAGWLRREVLRALTINGEGPGLVVRDQLQDVQRKAIQKQNGVLSVQTWSDQDGLDYDQEQRQIQDHQEEFGGGGSPLGVPADDDPTLPPSGDPPKKTLPLRMAEDAKPPKGLRLDECGGVIPQDRLAAAEVDLLSLPEAVPGTNCFNCRFISRRGDVGFCQNAAVRMWVNDRNCCMLWDHAEARRDGDAATDDAA